VLFPEGIETTEEEKQTCYRYPEIGYDDLQLMATCAFQTTDFVEFNDQFLTNEQVEYHPDLQSNGSDAAPRNPCGRGD
jgi:hypothetical protein